MCECIRQVNVNLKSLNGRLARGLTINRELNKMDISPPMIMIEKLGKGQKPPIVLATYCPFCGVKY